jgi:hypothetical protein
LNSPHKADIRGIATFCPLLDDTVGKGFWEGSPSNIDSKPASNAQDRFKKSVSLIRLLRVGGMLRTFSTATDKSGHCSHRSLGPNDGTGTSSA